ncbi:hypothetical protein HII31_04069 [Pseudocercospora fuligena]|uniref:Uncharacterized protein n=1 Tax=Pseudocercospora fuligena TaxID=685502 RepID=A0A8H6VJA3_9PEZI|nr:hypothetical protein HII31_04069 [Pseudocercospora fuligena]
MKFANTQLFAALPATCLATCGTPYPSSQIDGTLVHSIVLDMGTDAANVTASQYDQYFTQDTALEGVKAIIASGNLYVNLWAIPANETAFQENSLCTSGGYLVDQVAWLFWNSTTESYFGAYKAGTEQDDYDAAALSVATALVAGLEVRFWDTNGDGYTDLIDADYMEGVTVETITKNSNGTYSVYRGDIDLMNVTPYEGANFDADKFSGSGPSIPEANFDTNITSGSVALFWYGNNGWAMKKAQQVTGIFVDGADHTFYDIDDVTYEDAMLFSRDNLFISNRPGEFTDAQKFFQFTKDSAAGLDVSLWLVPVTNTNNTGAPIGMTSDGSSRTFLSEAITHTQEHLDNVTVSDDGSDVSSDRYWVTQDVYTQLDDAIARANASLTSANSTSFLFDYQSYILYLTLNGSATDIGAAYAYFNYTGFLNEEQYGTA